MNGYLLDTNIVSVFAPERPRPAPDFAEWLERRSDRLFLSVISIVEIEAGIKKLHRLGGTTRANSLGAWLDRILDTYGERILAFDMPAGRIAGAIADQLRAAGRSPGLADIAIAAIARHHELLLLTANERHFESSGVRYANPFEALPP